MPERLRRLDYTFQRRPIYFVTACTHQRENILDRADIHTRLGQFGKEGPEHGAWLGAYVLMRENPVRAGLVTDWREWPFLGEVFDLDFRDDRF
jgi:hypothetical protein